MLFSVTLPTYEGPSDGEAH